jgi:hypothetical protein
MESLPEDILAVIWKKIYSQTVVCEILQKYDFVWREPSDRLINLCKDSGTIQQNHHGLEDMIEDDHNMWAYNACIGSQCANCVHYGFPCSNLALYGFNNSKLDCLWQPNFVQ